MSTRRSIWASVILASSSALGCGGDTGTGTVGPSGVGASTSTGGSGGSTVSGGGGAFGGGSGGSSVGGSGGSSVGGSGGSSVGGSGGSSVGGSGGSSSGAVPSCNVAWSNMTPACGTSVTANWSCNNAQTCSYACTGDTPSSGSIACTGTAQFPISHGEACTLTSHNGQGSTTSSWNVSCEGKPACAVHFDVPGPPSKCPANGTAVWSCTGATSCSYSCTGSLSGSGSVACNGSLPLTLSAATTCTLTASNGAGSVDATVSASCP